MSVTVRINVLNETIEELQEMLPDLFVKASLTLDTLSMMELTSAQEIVSFRCLSKKLKDSFSVFQKTNQQQLQGFITDQVSKEEQRTIHQQALEYEGVFGGLAQNLSNKQTILLTKRGLKPSKRSQNFTHQGQAKHLKDSIQLNKECRHFCQLVSRIEESLVRHGREVKSHKSRLQKRVQKLQWTAYRKPESYFRCINSEGDKLEIQSPPVLVGQVVQPLPQNTSRPQKQAENLTQDLISMVLELRDQNKGLSRKLAEEAQYTRFLEMEHIQLVQSLGGLAAQTPVPAKLSLIQALQRKRVGSWDAVSVQSL